MSRLTELENRYDGPIPPLTLAAAMRPERLSAIDEATRDLTRAREYVVQDWEILRRAVKRRWEAKRLARAARGSAAITAHAFRMLEAHRSALLHLSHFKSARQLVQAAEDRLETAERRRYLAEAAE